MLFWGSALLVTTLFYLTEGGSASGTGGRGEGSLGDLVVILFVPIGLLNLATRLKVKTRLSWYCIVTGLLALPFGLSAFFRVLAR